MLLDGVVPFENTKIKPLNWDEIPFDSKAGGCGASMRAMCNYNNCSFLMMEIRYWFEVSKGGRTSLIDYNFNW
jgi:hypothetical protein